MTTLTVPARLRPMILAGVVTQFFELPLGRTPRPGQVLRLLDDDQRALIAWVSCVAVLSFEVTWRGRQIAAIREAGIPLLHPHRAAIRLGYDSLAAMSDDFATRWGARFMEGRLIEWRMPNSAVGEAA